MESSMSEVQVRKSRLKCLRNVRAGFSRCCGRKTQSDDVRLRVKTLGAQSDGLGLPTPFGRLPRAPGKAGTVELSLSSSTSDTMCQPFFSWQFYTSISLGTSLIPQTFAARALASGGRQRLSKSYFLKTQHPYNVPWSLFVPNTLHQTPCL